MGSLRFPFFFPHRSDKPSTPPFHAATATAVAAAAVGVGVGLAAISSKLAKNADALHLKPENRSSPAWAVISLEGAGSGTAVEPKTGAEFPAIINGTQRLLGVGVRRKSLLGLKNIDVYAFGVYAAAADVKKLRDKHGILSDPESEENRMFYSDVLDLDIGMTVRLQIVYGRLSIRSVRNAFEESVGSRLKKFCQSDNSELLQRFTSIFKDEYKIPHGTLIDISREEGYMLRTKIDGKEVGCIQSKLLCKSIFDLYVGENPFDGNAKKDFELGLTSLMQE